MRNQVERTIAARFVEAADVERRLPRVAGPRAGGYWPAFEYDAEDRKGWTEADQAEDRQRWAARRDITAAELSRYAEVVSWTIDHIPDVSMRRLVWTWAFCQVIPGRSFVVACDRNGWVRSTAYARLERLWSRLGGALSVEGGLLREPADLADGQLHRFEATSGNTLAQSVTSADAVPNQPYRTEPSRDLPEARDFSFAQRQAEREAKRRRKLGMEDAA